MDFLLDILFPQENCCLCQKPGIYGSCRPWCHECDEKVLALTKESPICEKCGKYIETGQICKDCQSHFPQFEVARAVGPYEGCFRITTKVLKFMGRKQLAPRMGHMMAKKVQQEEKYGKIELIVPVPISLGNLKERGFNQTELLGKQISKELRVKMDPGVIIRVKETQSQRELSKEEREKNLLCAFRVKDPYKVKGKNVLLVDDVYTTGSTSRECTRVLLDAGARQVGIITWAIGRGF